MPIVVFVLLYARSKALAVIALPHFYFVGGTKKVVTGFQKLGKMGKGSEKM